MMTQNYRGESRGTTSTVQVAGLLSSWTKFDDKWNGRECCFWNSETEKLIKRKFFIQPFRGW